MKATLRFFNAAFLTLTTLLLDVHANASESVVQSPPTSSDSTNDSTNGDRLSDKDNIKIIKEKRKESLKPRSTHQTTIIAPTGASRQSLDTHINSDPSHIPSDTGEITASGLSIPRIRGQDSRLTSLYVDHIKLNDPWTSYPILADIDLRAFGSLETSRGLGVHGLDSPSASLSLRSRPISKDLIQVGSEAGDAFGLSLWGSAQKKINSNYSARFYARSHETSGKYLFYNDNSTPYNENDDDEDIRSSNQSASRLFVPFLSFQNLDYLIQYLGIFNEKSKELPLPSNKLSRAKSHEKTNVHSLGLKRFLLSSGDFYSPQELKLNLSFTQRQEIVDDPERNILFGSDSFELSTESTLLNTAVVFPSTEIKGEFNVSSAKDAKRSYHSFEIDQKFELSSKNTFSLLALSRSELTENNQNSSTSDFFNFGSTLKVDHNKRITSYLQFSKYKRSPSLLETYGTGSGVQKNLTLDNELTTHYELGGHYKSAQQSHEMHYALFNDLTTDKIVFVRASSNTSKALNIGKTNTKGFEIFYKYIIGNLTTSAGWTQLAAENVSQQNSSKFKIPRTPEESGVASIAYDFDLVMVRFFGKYRGDVYQDESNKLVLPGFALFDLYLDSDLYYGKQMFQLGLSINNLFSKTSVKIKDTGTSELEGFTSISNISGYPLPGRTFKVSLSAKI